MKLFIYKSFIILFVIFLCLFSLEYYNINYNDSYLKRKQIYIEQNENKVEGIILGPSHSWRAINPALMSIPMASFAIPNSALNLDYLFFERYKDAPNLKVIILDFSLGYLEIAQTDDWIEHSKLRYYFDIDTKNKSIREYFITQYPLIKSFETYNDALNKWGFYDKIETEKDIFKQLKNDSLKISKRYTNIKEMKKFNRPLIDENFAKNAQILQKMKVFAVANNIKLILINPPKYFIYNKNINANFIERRTKTLSKLVDNESVYFWNFEDLYEYNIEYFFNLNHMNPTGAEQFTNLLNTRINKLLSE